MFDNEEEGDDDEDEEKIFVFDDNPTHQDEPDINYFKVFISIIILINKII
jgi:hypothetical protein